MYIKENGKFMTERFLSETRMKGGLKPNDKSLLFLLYCINAQDVNHFVGSCISFVDVNHLATDQYK